MRRILVGVAIIVLFYLSYGLLISPAKKRSGQIKQEKELAEKRIDEIQSKMRELGSELVKVSLDRESEKKKVIVGKNDLLPVLFKELAFLGRANEIKVSSISPGPFKTMTIPSINESSQLECEKISVAMRMRCRYRNLGEYLKGLEGLEIPVSVTSLTIEGRAGELPTLDASLEITTYAVD